MGDEKNQLLENLSICLSSGMDVISALASIRTEINSSSLKTKIDIMSRSVQGGAKLWKVLSDSGLYPHFVISLIKIGEESGRLSENLKIALKEQQKQKLLRSKLTSALIYPVFVLFLTLVVGTGIAWFILPSLAKVFGQLDITLPLITKVLIWIGLFLGTYGIIVVPLFIFFIAAFFYFVFVYKGTKFIGEKILFSTPVLYRLYKEMEISRFGFLLGTLLNAGITILGALDSLSEATSSERYAKFYKFLQLKISQGNSLQSSFNLSKDTKKLIPNHVIQMISASEQSGSLPETLLRVDEIYQEKVESTTKNLTVLLEPILLIIVWLGVLFVAIAVILPIYSLIGGLNK